MYWIDMHSIYTKHIFPNFAFIHFSYILLKIIIISLLGEGVIIEIIHGQKGTRKYVHWHQLLQCSTK